MVNVLITAVGGDISQGALRALHLSGYRVNTVGTDIDPKAAGLYMVGKGYIVERVKKNPEKYLRQIISICRQEKIDIVFCCNEDEQDVIAANVSQLGKKTKAHFVVQPKSVLTICRDKLKTYRFLAQKGIRVPEAYADRKGVEKLLKKYGWPLAVKPRGGYGGYSQFKIVRERRELRPYFREDSPVIFQEYIDNGKDEEYTVGIFLDNNSKALGAIPMLRKLRFSLSWHAIAGDYPDVVGVAVKAVEAVGATGPCNVQLRRDKENKPCVIEINARISSTVDFRAELGFNEVKAAIDYFLFNKHPKLVYKPGVAMRTWSRLVVPVGKYEQLNKTGKIINRKRFS